MLTITPPSTVLAWLVATSTTAAGGGPPVELLWATQAVTLLVGLASGWFALRSKRGEVSDSRQARFDARVDKDLDEALATLVVLRHELDEASRRIVRYEAFLIRAGIDPTTGRKEGEHGDTPTGDRSDDTRLIVGKRNRIRLLILMACVALAFVLANMTSYLIGANADRRTDARIAALEQQVRDELNTRRAARDAEQATRDATTEQFRRDVCVLADHIYPRDHAVQQFRMRWGCTTTPGK